MTSTPPSIGMCFDRTFDPAAIVEYARRLETGGVDELWVIEDCFYTTAPPLAAAALAATSTLTVGLGILPAVARTAAITAMEISTLGRMAPGRVVGGIGHGVQSWMQQMGVRPRKPVATLEEVFQAVRALLRGEKVTSAGQYVTLQDVALDQPPALIPPMVAGVRGPKSLAAAGRCADGVLLDGPCPPEYVTWARTQIGNPSAPSLAPADFRIHAFALMCITDDRRTSYSTMAPVIAEHLAHRHPGLLQHPHVDEMVERFDTGGVDALAAMPSEWWTEIGAIGTLDDAVAYVHALGDAGVRGVSMFPAPDLDLAWQQMDDVIALARATTS